LDGRLKNTRKATWTVSDQQKFCESAVWQQ
jgi:hypothetical protein